LRQLWQENGAQPPVERHERFVRIYQNNVGSRSRSEGLQRRCRRREVHSRLQRVDEAFRRRLDVTPIYVDRRHVGLLGHMGELNQQGCLTHAPRAKDIEHVKRQFGCGVRSERRLKQGPFFSTSHEVTMACSIQALCQARCHGWSYGLLLNVKSPL